MNDINDCLDRLEKIVCIFDEEWGNEPSAIAIYDSGLLQILTTLHALLTNKYETVDVMQDVETFLEYDELSKRFQKIEEDLSFAVTETYREVQMQSLGDAYDKLVDLAIDYPLNNPIVTPQELHERVLHIKFLTEDTYRIIHFYVSKALVDIHNLLFLNYDEKIRIEIIVKGFRDYQNQKITEFRFDLCYIPSCEKIAGFFRDSITEESAPKHWEQLFRIDKFTIDYAEASGRNVMNRKEFRPKLVKAVRELLSSTIKLDREVEDICNKYIQSYFVNVIFNNMISAYLVSCIYSKEKSLIYLDKLNFKIIGQLLNSKNIKIFYDIIHRYNVIQCRMFPELKPKYEQMLGIEPLPDESKKTNTQNIVLEKETLFPFVTRPDLAKGIVAKIIEYQKGKYKPKDVAQPVRAAIDAGVIRRPTETEYSAVKGFACITKSSLSEYTNPEKEPYLGTDYDAIVNDFKSLLL